MQLEDLRVFHSIVETGGFVKASQALNLPKSSLSRRVKNIEATLGVRLFNRNNRGTQITPQGEQYYKQTKHVLTELQAINDSMAPNKEKLEGQLRIKIPADVAFLVQLLLDFAQHHPDAKLDIITDNDYLDLNTNRLDFAFEGNDLPPTRYIARHLGNFKLDVICSPDYIKQHGRPSTLSELRKHNCLLFRNANGEVERTFKVGRKRVKIEGNLIMETATQHMMAAIQGMGIAFLPRIITQTAIKKGELVSLFPDEAITTVSFHLLYPSREYVSPIARRFIDFVMEQVEHSQRDIEYRSGME